MMDAVEHRFSGPWLDNNQYLTVVMAEQCKLLMTFMAEQLRTMVTG